MKKILYGLFVSTACLFMACTKNDTSNPGNNNPGNNNGNAICKQFEISYGGSGNTIDTFKFDTQGRLIHQSSTDDDPTAPSYDFINFTYDAQSHRQNNVWVYTYDASGNISKISAGGTNGITYNVTPGSINSYTLNTSDTDTNTGEVITTMVTASYTYNAAGDAVSAVANSHSSDGKSSMSNYEIAYTDTLSYLNNDPMVHFYNLNIWTDGLPIVSHHLIKHVKLNFSGTTFPSVTANWSFTYVFDANGRPVKITTAGDNSSGTLGTLVYDISYQCN